MTVAAFVRSRSDSNLSVTNTRQNAVDNMALAAAFEHTFGNVGIESV